MSGVEEVGRVFVIAGDPAIYKALCRIGKGEGFSSVSFANSLEFFSWFEDESSVDGGAACIVLDASTLIAGMDWYANDRLRPLPKVCIGVPEEIKPVIEMLTALEGQFIRRPFTMNELRDSVAMAFRRHAAIVRDRLEANRMVEDFSRLSRREDEVFGLVAKGHTNQEISDLLGISIKTVKAHRSKVMKKTNSRTLPDLVRNYEKREQMRAGHPHSASSGDEA